MSDPIAVGWVLLKILETIWKGCVLLLCAGLAALTATFAWPILFPTPTATTSVAISRPSSGCSEDRPFLLKIENDRRDYLGEVEIRLNAFGAKTGTELTGLTPEMRTIKAVMPPRESTFWCISGPEIVAPPDEKVVVSATVNYASALDKSVPIPREMSDRAARWSKWPAMFVGGIAVISALAMIFIGGWGLLNLLDRIFGSAWVARSFASGEASSGSWPIFVAGGINAVAIAFAPFALEGTGVSEWITGVDAWSRHLGLSDSGQLFLFSLGCGWPWAVVLLWGSTVAQDSK